METVLLLGDSIRMFYCPYVKEILKEQCNVVWPEENCRFTLYTLRCISDWISLTPNPEDVTLIHWNNGLWDMTRHTLDGEPLVSLPDYERNLKRIIFELRNRYPNAKIVFATTTCVDPKIGFIHPNDVVEYNKVAVRLMQENNIPVNDLYSLMAAHPEFIRQDDLIHETDEGAQALASQVAECILRELTNREVNEVSE